MTLAPDPKAGVRTSEFLITAANTVGPYLAAVFGVLPPIWAAAISAVAGAVYAAGRAAIKARAR